MTISKNISTGLAGLTGKLPVLLLSAFLAACGGGGGSSDGGGSSSSSSSSGGKPPVNTAPEAGDQSLSTDENTALDITLSGSDADDDALTYAITGQPANGVLTGTSPNLTYIPATNYEGSDSFRFIVSDGTDDSAEAIVNITVDKAHFSIGGTVSGLVNTGLVLQNNDGDRLEVAGPSFEFPTQLTGDSSYAVTVAEHPEQQLCSAENATGTLAGDDVHGVSVMCRYWRTAELIETDDAADATSPQVAFDGAGNAVAVWRQGGGTRNNKVWSNTWSPGSGWGTAELIETDESGLVLGPQIATSSAGNAIAVWQQYDGSSKYNIRANTWSPDSGWSTSEVIHNNTGRGYHPKVDVDSVGNAVVVWQQGSNIVANTWSPGSSWGVPESIEADDAGNADYPQIAVASAGNAIAVWQQDDGSRYNIWGRTWSPDSGWGTAKLLENDDDGTAQRQQVAADSAGNAIAVWRQSDGMRYGIRANTWSPDNGWGSAKLIDIDDAGHADYPQIAFNSAGKAIALWQQGSSIAANTWSSDNGWGTAEVIATDDARNPQIAMDSAGNAIAVWHKDDNAQSNIYAKTYSPDNGWGIAKLIETDDAGGAKFPQVAIDDAGNAIVVWSQHDGTRDNIRASRFE